MDIETSDPSFSPTKRQKRVILIPIALVLLAVALLVYLAYRT